MKDRILKILLANPKIENVTPQSNLVTDFDFHPLTLQR